MMPGRLLASEVFIFCFVIVLFILSHLISVLTLQADALVSHCFSGVFSLMLKDLKVSFCIRKSSREGKLGLLSPIQPSSAELK